MTKYKNNLNSYAQRQSFWSSLTAKTPKTLMERKIVSIDQSIRDLALNYNGSSLEKEVKLAEKAFQNNNLLLVRKHLSNFNQCLSSIIDAFNSDPDLSSIKEKIIAKKANLNYNLYKTAGFLDFLKKKEKPLSFEEKHETAISDKKEGIGNFVSKTIVLFNNIKKLFDVLSSKKSELDVIGYIKAFINLEYEYKEFSEAFKQADKEYFNPLFHMRSFFKEMEYEAPTSEKIKEEIGGMKEKLFEPKPYSFYTEKDKKDPYKVFLKKDVLAPPITPIQDPSLFEAPSASEFDFEKKPLQEYTVSRIEKSDLCPCQSGKFWGDCHGKPELIRLLLLKKGLSPQQVEEEMQNQGPLYQSAQIGYANSINAEIRRKQKLKETKEEVLEKSFDPSSSAKLKPFISPLYKSITEKTKDVMKQHFPSLSPKEANLKIKKRINVLKKLIK